MSFNDVLDEVRRLATERQRIWRDVREGVAIEFADRCDIFVVNAPSIDSLPQQRDARAAQALIDRYDRLDAAPVIVCKC